MAITPSALLLLCLSLSNTILALPQPQQATQTASAPNGFPSMKDTENTGALEGGASARTHNSAAGADGDDKGAFRISTGGLVAIAVVIALVVIAFGKSDAALFPIYQDSI